MIHLRNRYAIFFKFPLVKQHNKFVSEDILVWYDTVTARDMHKTRMFFRHRLSRWGCEMAKAGVPKPTRLGRTLAKVVTKKVASAR